MANLFSSAYGTTTQQNTTSGAITQTSNAIYKGPTLKQAGETVTRTCTYTGTIPAGDVLFLAGGLTQGERLVSFDCSMSGDPDPGTGTVHVGYSSDNDGILASSILFRAGLAVNVETSGQVVPGLTAVAKDSIILTAATGGHATSVTYTFTIVTTV